MTSHPFHRGQIQVNDLHYDESVRATLEISNYFINASASVEAEAEAERPAIAYHEITAQNQKRKMDPETLTGREKR